MKKMNKKGFTVVELVIVIAVIAVLAAVLIPTFAGIIHKADVSNDTQLVKNLNTALVTDTKNDGTMAGALKSAASFGYDVAKINASATDNEILWDSVNNIFCYLNDGNIEYIPENPAKKAASGQDFWVIDKIVSEKYSTYLCGDVAAGATVEAKKNLDVTALENINVIYKGEETVSIYTNGGNLTVENEKATVNHYGVGATLTVNAVAENSYHEFGSFDLAKIVKGRVVIENGGKLSAVIVDEANASNVKLAVAKEGKVEVIYAPETLATEGEGAIPEKSTIITAEDEGWTVVTTADELKAALANEEVAKIALGAQIDVENDLTKSSDKEIFDFVVNRAVELNLNSYNINVNHVASTGVNKNNAMFCVTANGELTLTGAGQLNFVTNNQMGWNALTAVIYAKGDVVIDGAVKLANLGGTDMAYGIDMLAWGSNTVDVTINAGMIYSANYRAVRMFNSKSDASTKFTLTINGGEVCAANNNAIMLHQGGNGTGEFDFNIIMTDGIVSSNGYTASGVDRKPVAAFGTNEYANYTVTGGQFLQNGIDVTVSYK